MTRGPAIWPTIVASTPKCASAVTSVSAVRWSAPFRRPRRSAGETLEDAAIGQHVLALRRAGRRRARSAPRCRRPGRRAAAAARTAPPRRRPDSRGRRRSAARGARALRAARDDFVSIRHFLGPGDRAADGVVRAAEQGAVGGAREHEPAREQRGQAEERGAGAAEQHRDPAAEHVPDGTAVLAAERDHQPDDRHARARCETASRRGGRCGRASGRRRRSVRAALHTRPTRSRRAAPPRSSRRRRRLPSPGRAARRGRGRRQRARARSARDARERRGRASSSSSASSRVRACAAAAAASSSWLPWRRVRRACGQTFLVTLTDQ